MVAFLSFLLTAILTSQNYFTAKLDTHACNDKEFMEDFANALVDSDEEAIRMALVAMTIATDDCVEIPKGQRVSVTDVGFFDPIHEVRIRGRLGRYYVVGGLFESSR